MSDLVKRLRSKHCCVYGCHCDEAADRIEQLERELRVYMDAAEGHMVERMRQLDALAAEKALADRLRMAGNSLAVSSIPWSKADADYRKKRGL